MSLARISATMTALLSCLALTGCPSSNSSGPIFAEDGVTVDLPPATDIGGETITPEGCVDDSNCPVGKCNPVTHTCVECLEASDCGANQGCVQWQCVPLVACKSDADCSQPAPYCDPVRAVCVECYEDAQCDGGKCLNNACFAPCDNGCPEGAVCLEDQQICVQCIDDSGCPDTQWCNVVEYTCYQDECEAGKAGCVGNATAMCADNGSGWVDLVDCPPDQTCQDGQCVEGPSCVPGMVSCKDAFTVLTCAEDGSTLVETPCPEGTTCFNGLCSQECKPACENKECGDSGCPGFSCGDCPEGMHCGDDFTCKKGICQPGTTICTNGGVAECLGKEIGWSEAKPCPPKNVCVDGLCVPQGSECEPGAVACQGSNVMVCSDDGSWTVAMTCTAAQVCQDGLCIGQGECQPGELACEGDTVIQCSTTGSWEVAYPCKPGTQCKKGQCVEPPVVCTPGTKKCEGNNVLKCNAEGTAWKDAGPCPPGAFCSNGECLPGGGDCAQTLECMSQFKCDVPEPVCMQQCFDAASDPASVAYELYFCVFQVCGQWVPQTDCFKTALNGKCVDIYNKCVGSTCQPKCANKDCGPDGCGGNCGSCPAGSSCNTAGICVQSCFPDCTGKPCGSDGCGGICGLCGPGTACKNFTCVADLSCKELVQCMWGCAPMDEPCTNGCWLDASWDAKQQWMELWGCVGQICGENANDGCAQQAIQGQCKKFWQACQDCTSDCTGKMCGPDGCGGDCGTCPGGFACDNYGYCLCQPQCAGKACGNDGCGGSCGTCKSGSVCNYLGKCVCMPQCEGKQCGPDGCGGQCGQCQPGSFCTDSGTCQPDQPFACGDGWCDPNMKETCQTCPWDCGKCAVCGDGLCDWMTESCETCPWDCGECTVCGDGWCDWQTEDCWSCPWDCGECAVCGDGWCDWQTEDCWSCPKDCGQCAVCGDGQCAPGYEDCWSCPKDCGQCSVCGDGKCAEGYENCWSCPKDCGQCQGGGCCDAHNEPGCDDPDVVSCVCAMDAYCCDVMWDGICVNEAIQQCGASCAPCQPSCVSSNGLKKQCGDDGCGGSCGICPVGTTCDQTAFKCVPACTPSCLGKKCGDDGCGGVCGVCPAGQACTNGQCVASKSCSQVLQCALDCNLGPLCTLGCYGDADAQSQALFQAFSQCIIQACGWNPSQDCILKATTGACAAQFKACAADM